MAGNHLNGYSVSSPGPISGLGFLLLFNWDPSLEKGPYVPDIPLHLGGNEGASQSDIYSRPFTADRRGRALWGPLLSRVGSLLSTHSKSLPVLLAGP